jgi:hypothetical protein
MSNHGGVIGDHYELASLARSSLPLLESFDDDRPHTPSRLGSSFSQRKAIRYANEAAANVPFARCRADREPSLPSIAAAKAAVEHCAHMSALSNSVNTEQARRNRRWKDISNSPWYASKVAKKRAAFSAETKRLKALQPFIPDPADGCTYRGHTPSDASPHTESAANSKVGRTEAAAMASAEAFAQSFAHQDQPPDFFHGTYHRHFDEPIEPTIADNIRQGIEPGGSYAKILPNGHTKRLSLVERQTAYKCITDPGAALRRS